MSESQKKQNDEVEVRELNLEEMDDISGGSSRKQEELDKLQNQEQQGK